MVYKYILDFNNHLILLVELVFFIYKTRGDHKWPGPARKIEGLGAKIWPDGRFWADNKWPDFFGTGLGFAFGPRAGPARPERRYVALVLVDRNQK